MPLARIDLIKGKPAEYRQTVGDVVSTAMVEVLKAPKDDRFQVIAEHDESNFISRHAHEGVKQVLAAQAGRLHKGR